MQETLTLHLTGNDISDAGRTGACDELLSLLALRTKSLWRLMNTGEAQEIMAPFRKAQFWVEVSGAWQTYQAICPLPSCVRAEIKTVPQDEIKDRLWSTLNLPQDGIAHLAYHFFEAREAQTNIPVSLAAQR